MSSWIVKKEHITALVDLATVPGDFLTWYHGADAGTSSERMRSFENYVTRYDDNGAEINYWDSLGRMLWFENYRGVNARYSENDAPPVYEHRFTINDPRTMPTPVEGIKVARCYAYQSCDSGDVWDNSEAKAFVDALVLHLIDKLPGYNAAPWGWDESNAHASRQISIMDMIREQ